MIVRTRNRPSELREALQSLTRQKDVPLEAIVVNDGGEDVAGVVEEFAGSLDTTYIPLQPARGRCAAWNEGLRRARGSWIANLDDDDLYYPGALAALLEAAPDAETVVYGPVEAIRYEEDGEGNPVRLPFLRFGRPFHREGLLTDLHPELARHPVLQPLRPPRWFPLIRPFLPLLTWGLDCLDRAGLRLPRWVYGKYLMVVFCAGRMEAREGETSA
jgi:glycosyltransferase involved in cell wall biosynthesis